MALVSLCMVSLNCWDVIQQCLDSLIENEPDLCYEVILVDNASTDELVDQLPRRYPFVKLICNDKNVGFTRATNQAIHESVGSFILWLNTDTIIKPKAITYLIEFLQSNECAGIAGPKVLNIDGSFQPQCRRGLPTPFASICYFLHLDRVLRKNSHAQQYLLNNLPINEKNMVDAVSGCCLLGRRAMWDQIGPLDENIFAFGEDIDWCVTAKKAGWQVWYVPHSEIIHLKGQGGVHAKPFHKAWGMHSGMWYFYKKHLRNNYSRLTSTLVLFGICVSFLIHCAKAIPKWLLNKLHSNKV
jgi:GT2 family glycosyltransferase